MPPKRKSSRGGAKMQLYNAQGRGFFGDVWNGIKKGFKLIKDNKLISGVAGLVPHPLAQTIATGAKAVGMGRTRGKGKKKGGTGVGKIVI